MKAGVAIVAMAYAVALAGCAGNDPTGPVDEKNSGGVGNQTLLVQADIDLDPKPGGFLTRFEVDVRDRFDQPVSGAEVTIVWNYASLRLLEQDSSGTYTAQLSGSGSGTLELSVQKDSMYVRDVTLGNIGIHAILSPEADDTVPANAPLPVSWVSDVEAPFAILSTRDESFEVFDRGEFVIPDSLNGARPNQYVELLRYNEVQLSGGLRGSYFRVEIRTRTGEFVVSGS